REEVGNPKNHNYSLSQGEPSFRDAVAGWYKSRFNVDLNPDKEVIALIGSKEGLANMPRAFVDRGSYVLVPDPAYPVYANGGTLLSEGTPITMPLFRDNDFKPDISQIASSIKGRHKVKMMFLNYPNNPTAAVVEKSFLKQIVEFALEKNIIVCYDNAYSEITFDGYCAPSILSVDGALDIALEFNSCSKMFNMTGDRIGFAVGNRQLVEGLRKIKSQIDSGPPVYVQNTASKALTKYGESDVQKHLRSLNRVYQERRDLLVNGLHSLGFICEKPKGTFYVWLDCEEDSMTFATKLLEKGVAVTPGIGFGKYGEQYVRFSITRPKEEIKEACERIRTLVRQ
ncbi:aminotransferase class I/II-fold pyridoxal phosphate-dependent enzyme, partial [Candidatus Bathyarchaeota archaeon]|nr:aminotransferase class I/II-fold pyridoxal phosphate-dependent enzyme [Candidatus Bathyarchaeota archaeon]